MFCASRGTGPVKTMETPLPADPLSGDAFRHACSLPLRLELDAVRRILDSLHPEGHACLDIGFRSVQACKRLRAGGGYWTSAAIDASVRDRLAAALEATGAGLVYAGQVVELPPLPKN